MQAYGKCRSLVQRNRLTYRDMRFGYFEPFSRYFVKAVLSGPKFGFFELDAWCMINCNYNYAEILQLQYYSADIYEPELSWGSRMEFVQIFDQAPFSTLINFQQFLSYTLHLYDKKKTCFRRYRKSFPENTIIWICNDWWGQMWQSQKFSFIRNLRWRTQYSV